MTVEHTVFAFARACVSVALRIQRPVSVFADFLVCMPGSIYVLRVWPKYHEQPIEARKHALISAVVLGHVFLTHLRSSLTCLTQNASRGEGQGAFGG
jgi:hypothetical protein